MHSCLKGFAFRQKQEKKEIKGKGGEEESRVSLPLFSFPFSNTENLKKMLYRLFSIHYFNGNRISKKDYSFIFFILFLKEKKK